LFSATTDVQCDNGSDTPDVPSLLKEGDSSDESAFAVAGDAVGIAGRGKLKDVNRPMAHKSVPLVRG